MEPDTLIYARRSLTDRHDLGWTFDVERNWALVEALLTSDEAQVQWLFIYSNHSVALSSTTRWRSMR